MYQKSDDAINKKTIAIEICKFVDDPEISNVIETQVIFVECNIEIPEGWEISSAWKPEAVEVF